LQTGVLVAVALAAVGATWLILHRAPVIVAECTATAGQYRFTIDPDQAVNATTIATEARRQGLPNHAVSVGLAAALQESKLRNLEYGDRDSLGLFQQRPSQGWGTPEQILQPSYAAARFFRALAKVEGWEVLPIYQAAQRVQRSADARAYAYWDTESRTIARGLTGETPAGFSCRFPSVPRSKTTTRQDLVAAAAAALGPELTSPTPAHGWLVASWLISRAPTYSLERVSYDGWTWTPTRGWRRDTRTRPPGVSYSLRSPA
jgi:hypothetical protein